jgi:hypothetical protein
MPSNIPPTAAKPPIPPHASQQVARGQKPQNEKRRAGVALHQSGKYGDVAIEKREPTSHQAPTVLPPRGGC